MKNKKQYETPEMELDKFSVVCVISTSPSQDEWDDGEDDF